MYAKLETQHLQIEKKINSRFNQELRKEKLRHTQAILMIAIQEKNLNLIKNTLNELTFQNEEERDTFFNTPSNESNVTLLSHACLSKAGEEILQSLIENGSDLNAPHYKSYPLLNTLLCNANDDDIPTIQFLLDQGVTVSIESIDFCCKQGISINIIKLLINNLSIKNLSSSLLACLVYWNKIDRSSHPLNADQKNYLIDLINLLIQNGADINVKNDNNQTPLHYACTQGLLDKDIFSLLLNSCPQEQIFTERRYYERIIHDYYPLPGDPTSGWRESNTLLMDCIEKTNRDNFGCLEILLSNIDINTPLAARALYHAYVKKLNNPNLILNQITARFIKQGFNVANHCDNKTIAQIFLEAYPSHPAPIHSQLKLHEAIAQMKTLINKNENTSKQIEILDHLNNLACDFFLEKEENERKKIQQEFQTQYASLELYIEKQACYKPIIANLVIAASLIGLLAIAYNYYKTQSFFFTKTKEESLYQKIDENRICLSSI